MMKQQVRLSVAGGAGHDTQQQGLVIPVRICPKHNACFPCRGQSNLFGCAVGKGDARSEEHTSELQSLMRISYAVFCLKKKIKYKLRHYSQFEHTTRLQQ